MRGVLTFHSIVPMMARSTNGHSIKAALNRLAQSEIQDDTKQEIYRALIRKRAAELCAPPKNKAASTASTLQANRVDDGSFFQLLDNTMSLNLTSSIERLLTALVRGWAIKDKKSLSRGWH